MGIKSKVEFAKLTNYFIFNFTHFETILSSRPTIQQNLLLRCAKYRNILTSSSFSDFTLLESSVSPKDVAKFAAVVHRWHGAPGAGLNYATNCRRTRVRSRCIRPAPPNFCTTKGDPHGINTVGTTAWPCWSTSHFFWSLFYVSFIPTSYKYSRLLIINYLLLLLFPRRF